jgi:hypothetical protein
MKKTDHHRGTETQRRSYLHFSVLLWFLGYLLGILCASAQTPASIQLKDMTRESGIKFVHTDGSSGKRYIVESVASGLALFD